MAVLSKKQAESLYDRVAGIYDRLLTAFRITGAYRWRENLIVQLNLQPGNHVVDLCGGTGANLPLLHRAVGASGKITIVDLSANMLTKARKRAEEGEMTNVELV